MQHELVTVFGGSGFVGRHVVRELARAGYRLRVAVRRPNLANFLIPMGRVGQIQLMGCTVAEESAVARALDGAAACVNLVGILSQGGRQRFTTLHAEAPGLIGRCAAAAGLRRVIHISAIGADPQSPSRYGRSKAQGEAAVTGAFPAATILRPSIVFGPEDSFFNRFANMARYFPALPLIGGGKTRFQPVFAGDVATAVHRVLERPDTAGRIGELGGPAVYSFRELMEIILRETGRKRLLMPVPFPLAALQGLALGLLPSPPLTLDQVRQLKRDAVVGDGAELITLARLGIAPTAVEAIVPAYLWRFRKTGQFEVPAF